jgi:acylglycerol lipase
MILSVVRCDSVTVRAADGTSLVGCLWQPAAAGKGLVWLSHGYAEHIGRYAHVVETLLGAGIAVAGLDHRGHGGSDGPRALMPEFGVPVADFRTFVTEVETRVSPGPRVMLAHSMGAVIALHYAARYQRELAGLVLSGAAVRLHGVDFGRIRGFLETLSRTMPGFPVRRLDSDILTRDAEAVQRFKDDGKCYHGWVKAATAFHLLSGGERALQRASELTLPILAMHGEADTLAAPSGSRDLIAAAGSIDKTHRTWPDFRHEIFNELGKENPIGAARAWIERYLD